MVKDEDGSFHIAMSDSSDYRALPAAVERVIPVLRRAAFIGFWVQIVLAVIAGLIFLFSVPLAFPSGDLEAVQLNPGTGPGIFFALGGLVALGLSIYWTSRYNRMAVDLASPDPQTRPRRADTIKVVENGLIINLVGTFFSLLAAETITGTLLAKALQSQGVVLSANARLNQFIQPLDIFVVLGNTHTLVAHFAGTVTALWLLRWIHRS